MKKEISGFSVIELVIALAVGAIVVTMAAPTMTNMVRGNRLTSTSNSLTTALNYARMEAIRRQTRMRVAAVGGDWNGGWQVLQVNVGGNTVMRQFPAPPNAISVTTASTSYDFTTTGFLLGLPSGTTLDVCDAERKGRRITITGGGKVDLDPAFNCPTIN